MHGKSDPHEDENKKVVYLTSLTDVKRIYVKRSF